MLSLRFGVAVSPLYGGREILHDVAPIAFVVGSATVTFVNDDEVEEVGRIFAKVGCRYPFIVGAAHESLEDGEEDTGVRGDTALFTDLARLDAAPAHLPGKLKRRCMPGQREYCDRPGTGCAVGV